MKDKDFLVAIYSYVGFGPRRTSLLKEYFGTYKDVWNANKGSLIKVGLSEKIVNGFLKHRDKFDIKNYYSNLKRLSINFLTINDRLYPSNLKQIDNAPLVIYYKGEIKCLGSEVVAIVGSRQMTSYGRQVTKRFSSELSELGVVIVSGLARGIDSVAHRSCLNARGKTAAVLGCGLGRVYPLRNTELAREIIRKGGVLLSEYPTDYPVLPVNFVNRNRIISGLAKVVLVVEGARKSGTLLTASAAAHQGKEVFAVPGQITSPSSQAPHFLIKNGVKIAFSPRDIIRELDLTFKIDEKKSNNSLPISRKEKVLLTILKDKSLDLDSIVKISCLKVSDVTAALTIMEIKGLVKNIGKERYKKI
jgi:DNA processing protein